MSQKNSETNTLNDELDNVAKKPSNDKELRELENKFKLPALMVKKPRLYLGDISGIKWLASDEDQPVNVAETFVETFSNIAKEFDSDNENVSVDDKLTLKAPLNADIQENEQVQEPSNASVEYPQVAKTTIEEINEINGILSRCYPADMTPKIESWASIPSCLLFLKNTCVEGYAFKALCMIALVFFSWWYYSAITPSLFISLYLFVETSYRLFHKIDFVVNQKLGKFFMQQKREMEAQNDMPNVKENKDKLLKQFLQDVKENQNKVQMKEVCVINQVPRVNVLETAVERTIDPHLEVPIASKRGHLKVVLQDVLESKALLDLGATSSVCSDDLLEQVEDKLGYRLPRLQQTVRAKGFGDCCYEDIPIVLIDILIENRRFLKAVPFLIKRNSSKLILGVNIISACHVGITCNKEKFFVKFMTKPSEEFSILVESVELEEPYFAKATKPFTLQPLEVKIIEVKVLKAIENCKKEKKFTPGSLLMHPYQEFSPSQSMSSLVNVNKKGFSSIQVMNCSDFPMAFDQWTTVAEVQALPSNFEERIEYIGELAKYNAFFDKIEQIPAKCYCRFKAGNDFVVVVLADMFGFSWTSLSVIEFYSTWKTFDKSGVTWKNNVLFLRSDKNESYAYLEEAHIQKMIRPETKHKTYVLVLPCDMIVPGEIKRVMYELSKRGINVAIYSIQLGKACPLCDAIAISDLRKYLANSDLLRLQIVSINAEFQRPFMQGNEDYPILSYDILSTKFCLFRCNTHVVVLIHFRPESARNPDYMTFVLYSLLNQLRIRGAPKRIASMLLGKVNLSTSPIAHAFHQSMLMLCNFETKATEVLELISSKTRPILFEPPRCGCIACGSRRQKRSKPVSDFTTIYFGEINEYPFKALVTRNQSKLDKIDVKINELLGYFQPNNCTINLGYCKTEASSVGRGESSPEIEKNSVENQTRPDNDKENDKYELSKEDLEMDKKVSDLLKTYPSELPTPEEYHSSMWRPVSWREYLDPESFPKPIKERFINLLDKYHDIFSCDPQYWRPFNMKPVKLNFKSNEIPRPKPIINRSLASVAQMDKRIDEMILNNMAYLSDRPMHEVGSNPLFVIPYSSETKDKSKNQATTLMRLIIDLRKFNESLCMSNNDQVLRSPDELFLSISKAIYCISADLSKAYKSLLIDEESVIRASACIFTPTSRYALRTIAFTTLPDGASALPSIMQSTLIKALSPSLLENMLVYIDDLILLYFRRYDGQTEMEEEDWVLFLAKTELFFQNMKDLNALLNLKKCKFFTQEFECLGHEFDLKKPWVEMKMPNLRKEAMLKIKPPETLKQLQGLIGCYNYISRFIPKFAEAALPLVAMLNGKKYKRGQKFELNKEQMESFEKLKQLLFECQSLKLPRLDRDLYIVGDASICSVGLSMQQVGDDGKLQICSFMSYKIAIPKTLLYSSCLKEALCVFYGYKAYEKIVINATRTIFATDLLAIMGMLSLNVTDTTALLKRMSHHLYCLPFQYCLIYVPGRSLPHSDYLSRIYEEEYLKHFYIKKEQVDEKSILGYLKLPKDADKKIFSTKELMNHIYQCLIDNEMITPSLFDKRMNALKELWSNNFDEEDEIPPFVENLSLEIQQFANDPKTVEFDFIEFKQNPDSIISKVENSPVVGEVKVKLSPLVKEIDRDYVMKLQRDCEETQYILKALMLSEVDKIPPKLLSRFRVLDGSLLLARKKLDLPFTAPGNIKIYLTFVNIVRVMAHMHLMHAHLGSKSLSRMFNISFYGVYAPKIAELIVGCCVSCSTMRLSNKTYYIQTGLVRPPHPNHTWQIDVCHFRTSLSENETAKKLLVAVDLYSNFIFAVPIKDEKISQISAGLAQIFSTSGTPAILKSDCGPTLLRNSQMRKLLKQYNVDMVTTTAIPYRSTSMTFVEKVNGLLRMALSLNSKSFHRKFSELLAKTVYMLNNTPRVVLSNKTGTEELATPMSLHLGINPKMDLVKSFSDPYNQDNPSEYRQKWTQIISDFNKKIKEEYEEANQGKRVTAEYQEGDVVYYKQYPKDKHKRRFQQNLFEVQKVFFQKCIIKSMFFEKNFTLHVGFDQIKRYTWSHIADLLPEKLRLAYGKQHSPSALKSMEQTGYFPDVVREDINDFEGYDLRNRLVPHTEEDDRESIDLISDSSSSGEDEEKDNFRLDLSSPSPKIKASELFEGLNDFDYKVNSKDQYQCSTTDHDDPANEGQKLPTNVGYGLESFKQRLKDIQNSKESGSKVTRAGFPEPSNGISSPQNNVTKEYPDTSNSWTYKTPNITNTEMKKRFNDILRNNKGKYDGGSPDLRATDRARAQHEESFQTPTKQSTPHDEPKGLHSPGSDGSYLSTGGNKSLNDLMGGLGISGTPEVSKGDSSKDNTKVSFDDSTNNGKGSPVGGTNDNPNGSGASPRRSPRLASGAGDKSTPNGTRSSGQTTPSSTGATKKSPIPKWVSPGATKGFQRRFKSIFEDPKEAHNKTEQKQVLSPKGKQPPSSTQVSGGSASATKKVTFHSPETVRIHPDKSQVKDLSSWMLETPEPPKKILQRRPTKDANSASDSNIPSPKEVPRSKYKVSDPIRMGTRSHGAGKKNVTPVWPLPNNKTVKRLKDDGHSDEYISKLLGEFSENHPARKSE